MDQKNLKKKKAKTQEICARALLKALGIPQTLSTDADPYVPVNSRESSFTFFSSEPNVILESFVLEEDKLPEWFTEEYNIGPGSVPNYRY